MTYDSAVDTKSHIHTVRTFIMEMQNCLDERAWFHDNSKLESPEKELFDKYTPLLNGLTYGSDEYKQCLKEMGVALEHHYANNSHHPEHHPNGIEDMSLLDIAEMLCDWKAASTRHADGDIMESIRYNQEERKEFKLSPEMRRIFENTVRELGWERKDNV